MKIVAVLYCGLLVARAGEFVNLGFDDPDRTHAQVYRLPWEDVAQSYGPPEEVLRGWTLSFPWVGPPLKELWGLDADGAPGGLGPLSLYGPTNRALWLRERYPYNAPRPGLTISQVGLIPKAAVGLVYYDEHSTGWEPGPPTRIFLDGMEMEPRQLFEWRSEYSIDVSAFAGTEVELEFRFAPGLSSRFDIYGFVVPEPSAGALLAIGLCFLALRRRRDPSSSSRGPNA